MRFRNPLVNFEEAHSSLQAQWDQNYRDSFWLATYTFDLEKDFGVLESDEYDGGSSERANALERDFYPVLAKLQQGQPLDGALAGKTLEDILYQIDVYAPPTLSRQA